MHFLPPPLKVYQLFYVKHLGKPACSRASEFDRLSVLCITMIIVTTIISVNMVTIMRLRCWFLGPFGYRNQSGGSTVQP